VPLDASSGAAGRRQPAPAVLLYLLVDEFQDISAGRAALG
jgi:hypothetical protein